MQPICGFEKKCTKIYYDSHFNFFETIKILPHENFPLYSIDVHFNFPAISLVYMAHLPVHVGALLHSTSLTPRRMHVCLSGPCRSKPKLHKTRQLDINSLLQGGKIAPFSGASKCSQSFGSHTGILPVQVLKGEQIRSLDPISVYPLSQLKLHTSPVLFPHGSSNMPFRGANKVGHCSPVC